MDLKFRENPATGFRLRVYSESAKAALGRFMTTKSHEMETYMKSNHPWTNRTGNAEAGLKAEVTSASAHGWVQDLECSHSVYYGVYLEYSMGRRFAIIEPTINRFAPRIMSELGSIFSTVSV